MAELDPVVQKFYADMSAYGQPVDEGARKADRFGERNNAAALAARKMGLAAQEAGLKAARAQKEAADAAEKLAKGELGADEAAQKAAAAMRELERADIKAAEASLAAARAANQQGDQYRRTAAEAENKARKEKESAQQMQGGLASLIAVAGLAATAVTSAGVAVVAFAGVAVPSIKRVLDAQQNLSASWTMLNSRQRASSVLVQQLAGDYRSLAAAYEPQTLATFNGLVLTAKGMLPQLNTVLGASSIGVQGFFGQIERFVQGPDMAHFLTWSGNTAPAALHTLGTTATQTGTLATTLVEQVAPLGLTFLQAANGGLGLVNALAKSNPALAQLAITGLAVRAPMTALSSGVSNLATKMEGAAQGSGALSKAAKGLSSVAGLSPGLYVAAGTALAFFALKAFSAKTSTDQLIDSLRVATGASGNNLAGYKALGAELSGQLNRSMSDLNKVQVQVGGSGGKLAGMNAAAGTSAVRLTMAQRELRDAIAANDTAMRNVTSGSQRLGASMNVTASQARQLATAAGVDLSLSVDKSGRLTDAAAAKIRNYSAAVELAKNPTESLKLDFDQASNSTLLLKDRVAGLTAALDAYYNPSIAAYKATTALKDGYAGLLPQFAKAKGDMGGNTAASRQLQQAFASQTDAVVQLYTSTFQQTHSLDAASAAVKNQLPLLYALAGNNKDARAQVDALARSTHNVTGATDISHAAFMAEAKSMGLATAQAQVLWKALQAIKSKDVYVTVHQQAVWTTAHDPARRFPGLAAGGPVQSFPTGGEIHGPGTTTSDSVRVLASRGEFVVNAASYAANTGLVKAINAAHGRPVSSGGLGGEKSGSYLGPGQKNQYLGAMPLARRHYAETLSGASGGSAQPQVVNHHNFYIAGSVWSEQELLNVLQRVAFERGIDFNRPAGR